MVADMEPKERDGIGVDITREGMIIELEGEVNVVSCDVGVAAGVLDMAGIWLVSKKGSNDMESPEPKSPEPSGNIGVIETIGMLLLDRLLVVLENTGVMETIGMLLLITLPVTLENIGVMKTIDVLLLTALLVTIIVSAIVCVISIGLMNIPEEVKACEVG